MVGRCGVESYGAEYKLWMGSCKHGVNFLVSQGARNFLTSHTYCQLVKKDFAPCSWLVHV
jgi:hypothetical protein